MNKQMKIALVTFIVLVSSITVVYAVKPNEPNLITSIQNIMDLLITHDSDVQAAVTALQGSVDALPITEYVQGYLVYTLAAGEIPQIYASPTYPGGAHVSLTIRDSSLSFGDSIITWGSISANSETYAIPMAELSYSSEGNDIATTFEFNCESWFIELSGYEDSEFTVDYSATVTYNPVT